MQLLIAIFLCLSSLIQASQFHSQASQDKFVKTLLYDLGGKTDQGFYLEIGAADPLFFNNTAYFEKYKDWMGVSIDISPHFENLWKAERTNPLLIQDALDTDYEVLLKPFPQVIDYLTLDVDGYYDIALQKLPHDQHIFKVITIEHDAYRFGDTFRDKERAILNALGYHLLCANVSNDGCPFEDWWVHPSQFSPSILAELDALDLNGKDNRTIIQTIRSHFQLDL